jgi:PAS domain S-box-containing protein
MTSERHPALLALDEAAALLELPPTAVEALVGSGYLVPSRVGDAGPEFPLSDLKAFLARNADNGSGAEILHRALHDHHGTPKGGMAPPPTGDAGSGPGPRSRPGGQGDGPAPEPRDLDPQDLLDALDGRAAEMGRRAFQIFANVFPEAETWNLRQQTAFIEQATGRFEAILAVTSEGPDVDASLFEELRTVGVAAARSGSSLPQLLVLLRISRDLVVQTAIELAETGGRPAGLALSLVLTRIMPAMDRLTDALARGYWEATLQRDEEALARYRHVVERASDGVYEVDLQGRIIYANAAFALVVGRRLRGLAGTLLVDVLQPLDPSVTLEPLLTDGPQPAVVALDVTRADGVRRVLSVQPSARWVDGELVGFQGMVRDDTVEADFEADRSEFAALLRNDLRSPLAAIVGLSAMLESHADELVSTEHTASIGRSIRAQVERVSRLADDLSDITQVRSDKLRLYPRPVEIRPIVDAALASIDPTSAGAGAITVDVAEGLVAVADPRRLEQVVANLVDNALTHGSAPVAVRASVSGDEVRVAVEDHGDGVASTEALFAGRSTPTRTQRERARGRGIGLALVRGLVEAMGGRVWYERQQDLTRFVLTVPAPLRGT